jgi:hypothetical protein
MIFFIVINWGTVIYFKYKTPALANGGDSYNRARSQFLTFFLPFLAISSLLWFLVGLTNFLSGIYCRMDKIDNEMFTLIITVGNIAKIFIPFFFSLFRIRDPWIRDHVIQYRLIRVLYRLKPLNLSQLTESMI